MRDTDDLQTNITCSHVNGIDQVLSLELSLQMTLPMLSQDERLPDQIEAYVHQAGLKLQSRVFATLIEKADQELIVERRRGKEQGHASRA